MKTLFLVLSGLLLLGTTRSGGLLPHPVQEGTITNLYDAFGRDSSLQKDFGVSCILKFQGKTILFDAGGNADMFKKNVKKLKIDLRKVDAVIVSHGHFDHLNGIDYVLKVNPKVKIFMPYDIFWGAPVPFDATGPDSTAGRDLPEQFRYFDGGPSKFLIQQSGRFWGAQVEYVKTSRELWPGFTLVATSSPYMGYFSGYPNKSFVAGQFEEEGHEHYKYSNLPELSLSLRTEKGEVVIVGCSHSGIERIAEAAKQVTQRPIDLVYGGFHLIPFDRTKIEEIARYLKNELGVRRVAPAHCTGHLGFKVFQEWYAADFLYAGLGETIRF